jgi:hypothetical protein
MWCQHCQQDVPGILSDDTGKYCCPRCGEMLAGGQEARDAIAATLAEPPMARVPGESPAPGAAGPIPPLFDTWDVDEQLRHIGRLLNIEAPEVKIEPNRVDPPHKETPQAKLNARRQQPRQMPPRGVGVVVSFLAWAAIFVGTMLAVCGGVLLAWSLNTARPDLWRLGLPMAIAGAISLLGGGAVQWGRSRSKNRAPADLAPRMELSRDRSGRRKLVDGGSGQR